LSAKRTSASSRPSARPHKGPRSGLVRIFRGLTGASGAPYAARLVEALAAADCELGLCISRAGYEVLATELYRDVSLPQDEIAQRLTGGAEGVTIYSERDWKSPYASGSARVDAYVICPCSMGTLGTIASGAMSNLIHRAASVALKEERRLIVCPRETPLSQIHLRNMLELKQAGATILFLAAGLDQRWRTETARAVVSPGDRVLDACCGTGDLAIAAQRAGGRVTGVDFSEPMLERARAKSGEVEWIQGDALALPFADGSFDAATVGFGVRNLEELEAGLRELRRVLRPGGRIGILEITRPRGLLRPFYKLWFDGLVPLAGK